MGRGRERDRWTHNLRCIDLPAVSIANSSWPWCKVSSGGKLHVALLRFHPACTVSYSTKWIWWLSPHILPFLSDRERGKTAFDWLTTLALGLQRKYQHHQYHQHLQIRWCTNVLSSSFLLRKLSQNCVIVPVRFLLHFNLISAVTVSCWLRCRTHHRFLVLRNTHPRW